MLISTLYIVVLTLLIVTPVGLSSAIYLTQYAKQGRLVRVIRFATEVLSGVPSVLLSLPLKYMHTSVETIDLEALREGSRLLAHYLSELDAGWEDDLWI